MRTFSEFAYAFHKWRTANNPIYDFAENSMYAWIIPREAIEVWRHELDDMTPEFLEEYEVRLYRENFDKGGSFFGVYNFAESNGIECKLFKMTPYTLSFSTPSFLCSCDGTLPMVSQRITLEEGIAIDSLIRIKYNSISTSGGFDLIDRYQSYDMGILMGHGYYIGQRNHNRTGEESVFGHVNYTNGRYHLVRSNTSNEEKFPKYYDWLVRLLSESSSESGGSSSSSHYGNDDESGGVPPYSYMSLSGSLVSLGDPCTKVFSFNIYEPDTDYSVFRYG